MHPYLRQAIAQAHADDLNRDAVRRRFATGLDARVNRFKVPRRRVTLRPARAGRVVRVNGAHQ